MPHHRPIIPFWGEETVSSVARLEMNAVLELSSMLELGLSHGQQYKGRGPLEIQQWFVYF